VEAAQNALVKLFTLLNKMVTGPELEEMDVVIFVLNNRMTLTNLYDFGAPFYGFAKRLARNELISQLRQEGRRSAYAIPLDDLESPSPAPFSSTDEDEGLAQAFCGQLRTDMTKLLEIVEHSLTPKPRQVILRTLGIREEFWRALKVAGLAAPPEFSPAPGLIIDADLAQALGMTENNIRVHRARAKQQVKEIDPNLALLLEDLTATRGKIKYRPLSY
jgi:DNA-directed RNA polymerase specialized sigma24 family protein